MSQSSLVNPENNIIDVTQRPDVSVVIYVDKYLESATQIYAYVANFLKESKRSFEFIFMDDGNSKEVFVAIEGIQGFIKNTKVIRFPRPCGVSTAMQVGFRHARGQYILTLGSFLQIEPGEIEKVFKKIDEGFDFVNGWRQSRKDSTLNQFHTRIYNWMVRRVSQVNIHDSNCTLKLFKQSIIEDLYIYGDLYRFLPILAARQGYLVGEVPLKQRREINPVGIYGPGTYVGRLLDLLALFFISRFITRPLRFFGPLGLLFLGSGFLIDIYLVYLKYVVGEGIAGRPLLNFGTLLIILGIQIISVGLIGEMIIFFQSRNVKNYRVEKILE